ncbi:MAG: hypothetical protein FD180_3204 [Planctomycetota bacterium]|nr:MAG: hypothetical protein FD180_3204 [Planctomycetota bacterium]
MNLEDVRASFGRQASFYANPQSAALFGDPAGLARMVELCAGAPGIRALDVATGTGFTALGLARAGCRVTALDLTRPMLLEARAAARKENIGVEFVEGDSHRCPLRSGSLDLVTCRLAAHHFPDPAAFVRESARVLAPGGRFYLFDISSPEDDTIARWIDDTETLRDPSHVSCWRGATWERLCASAGLRVVHSERPKWRYVMDHWFGRSDMTAEKRARLIERIKAVPSGWREVLSMDFAQDPPGFGTPLVEIVAMRD